jgi:hypothetical protein
MSFCNASAQVWCTHTEEMPVLDFISTPVRVTYNGETVVLGEGKLQS